MTGFYVTIYSVAAFAVIVAVLMRWPKLDRVRKENHEGAPH